MPDPFHKLSEKPLHRARGPQVKPKQAVSLGVDFTKLARMEAENDKRKLETLTCLTLTDKQKSFLAHKARKRLAVGANRAGKTSLLAIDIALVLTGANEDEKDHNTGLYAGANLAGCDTRVNDIIGCRSSIQQRSRFGFLPKLVSGR